MKYLMVLISVVSLLFSQAKTYVFTEEEIQTLYKSIQELEYTDSTNQKLIENLNSQIYIYIQTMENDSLMIEDYIKKLELKEDMIDLVKPKWYENTYIWLAAGFILGVF